MAIIGTVPKHQLVRHLGSVRCAIEGRSLGYFCIVHGQYPRLASPPAASVLDVCVRVCVRVRAPGICVWTMCVDMCTQGLCIYT
jgi:hypothetical protein